MDVYLFKLISPVQVPQSYGIPDCTLFESMKKIHKILLVDVKPIMFYKWDPSDTLKNQTFSYFNIVDIIWSYLFFLQYIRYNLHLFKYILCTYTFSCTSCKVISSHGYWSITVLSNLFFCQKKYTVGWGYAFPCSRHWFMSNSRIASQEIVKF